MNLDIHDESIQVLLFVVVPGIAFLAYLIWDLVKGKRRVEHAGATTFRPSLAVRATFVAAIAAFAFSGISSVLHNNLLAFSECLLAFELLASYPHTVTISDNSISWTTPWSSKSFGWTSVATFLYRRRNEIVLLSYNGDRLELHKAYYPALPEIAASVERQLGRTNIRANSVEPKRLMPVLHWIFRAAAVLMFAYQWLKR